MLHIPDYNDMIPGRGHGVAVMRLRPRLSCGRQLPDEFASDVRVAPANSCGPATPRPHTWKHTLNLLPAGSSTVVLILTQYECKQFIRHSLVHSLDFIYLFINFINPICFEVL